MKYVFYVFLTIIIVGVLLALGGLLLINTAECISNSGGLG